MSFLLAVSGLAAVSAPSAQAWTASSGWAAVGSKWSRDALFISDQVTAIPDMASKTSVSSSDRVTITTSLPVAVDDNLAVGPSTSPDHSGELALYGWTAASREIHRYDAATTPGASEDGSLGNLPSPGWTGATWGGEINQKTGQLYITSEYTDYIECSATNNSTNGGTIDLAIYNLGATSATLASTTGGTSPKPKTTSVCVMEQQRNGNSVTRWLVASDMAIDAEGNFYILLVSNSTPYVYYLVRVEPPRNNDGSLASSGTWLYTPVVRLTFNLGQPGSDLWGMAFMNGSLFLGDDEGHIFKVNTLTGDGVNLGDSGPLVRDFAAAQLAPMVRGKLNIDVDGDGQISAAEESAPGLANQTVGIYRQSDNAKLGELKTDDNGEYFGLLPSASDDLYIRVIQPQYNGVNVHQVKGYYWKGDDSLVTTLGQSHNEVKPMCYSASADGVKLSATGDCLGAKRSGIDPTTTSSVGSDANFISSVEMNQDLEVAVADFGFSANGSWGDAAAATKSTGADSGPNFANNSVRGVQLGDELGSYADGVNDANSAAHDADDGVSVRLVHDVDVPLQGQILSQGRNYPIHITGSKTDGVSGDIKVSGWASPVNAASPAGTTISSTATPWLSATLGSDGTYTTPTSAAYQAPTSPAVGFAKGVMRFQASTTAQTAPDNSGRAYAPAQGAADANTKAWVAPGEVEDYQVVYASAQLRVAAK
ncbi:MAG: hypothetical protein LBR32_05065, partial [Propionibacteriaceae bacterium]|nr:hypothetical protein [Propionibacteriaceae bacterium]